MAKIYAFDILVFYIINYMYCICAVHNQLNRLIQSILYMEAIMELYVKNSILLIHMLKVSDYIVL